MKYKQYLIEISKTLLNKEDVKIVLKDFPDVKYVKHDPNMLMYKDKPIGLIMVFGKTINIRFKERNSGQVKTLPFKTRNELKKFIKKQINYVDRG